MRLEKEALALLVVCRSCGGVVLDSCCAAQLLA
eukprot:COSAG02_NODE_134_length_34593_cov_43.594886_30_plen_33_part_00